jgi:biopolymer transport protein ExbB/TolQ
MDPIQRVIRAVFRSPWVWGSLASFGFYVLIDRGVIKGEYVGRYFTSHPVEYTATTFFFVALVFLFFKITDVAAQWGTLRQTLLGPRHSSGESPGDAPALLDRLAELPARLREGYLPSRLKAALEYVNRQGTADRLEDELKYLADADVAAANSSYAMVRIIIWAIPILGFLGTVIGITMAVSSLAPQSLEESLPTVTSGLGVAFDTTAQALLLSMVLMFSQYLVDRAEGRLLAAVDRRALDELSGRFEVEKGGHDPNLAAVRRMAEGVLHTLERLGERQTALWQAAMDAAHERWSRLTGTAGRELETALTAAISQGLEVHAREVAKAEQAMFDKQGKEWAQAALALDLCTRAMKDQEAELARQSAVLLRIVEASDHVFRLEEALRKNLEVLAASQNFEETLMTLSAAVNLLAARAGHAGGGRDAGRGGKIGHAA